MNYEDENLTSIKVVLLGESGVGKTSIISQYTANVYNPKCPTSVSAQYTSKIVNFPQYSKSIKFDIWDTVGQEKYRSLARIFYKDASVIIFVYDITTDFSFSAIKDFWYDETRENAEKDTLFALVANKIDLYQYAKVKNIEGEKYADEIGAIFQCTSAYNNTGIDKLFENLGKKILNPDYDYKNPDKEIYIKNKTIKGGENKIKLKHNNDNEKKEGKCC